MAENTTPKRISQLQIMNENNEPDGNPIPISAESENVYIESLGMDTTLADAIAKIFTEAQYNAIEQGKTLVDSILSADSSNIDLEEFEAMLNEKAPLSEERSLINGN